MISRAIGAKRQAGFFDLRAEPFSRGQMRVAECGTMHAAIARRTDLRERIEIGAHPLPIDSQHCVRH
jgi:hypothetical protein